MNWSVANIVIQGYYEGVLAGLRHDELRSAVMTYVEARR